MDTGSSRGSNTFELIELIQSMQGETFAEKFANAKKVLEARMSRVGKGSDEWLRLLRTTSLVGGLIRFERETPPKYEASITTLAAQRTS